MEQGHELTEGLVFLAVCLVASDMHPANQGWVPILPREDRRAREVIAICPIAGVPWRSVQEAEPGSQASSRSLPLAERAWFGWWAATYSLPDGIIHVDERLLIRLVYRVLSESSRADGLGVQRRTVWLDSDAQFSWRERRTRSSEPESQTSALTAVPALPSEMSRTRR